MHITDDKLKSLIQQAGQNRGEEWADTFNALTELAAYRANDQGLVSSVKLGQQLYQPYDGEIIEWDVGYITARVYGDVTLGCFQADDHDLSEDFLVDVVGSKLFFTREEAEAVLRKREGKA